MYILRSSHAWAVAAAGRMICAASSTERFLSRKFPTSITARKSSLFLHLLASTIPVCLRSSSSRSLIRFSLAIRHLMPHLHPTQTSGDTSAVKPAKTENAILGPTNAISGSTNATPTAPTEQRIRLFVAVALADFPG
jgi:hypothetical protein